VTGRPWARPLLLAAAWLACAASVPSAASAGAPGDTGAGGSAQTGRAASEDRAGVRGGEDAQDSRDIEADLAGQAPPQVVRLLDAWALRRARATLALEPPQVAPFMRRFRQLQELRRRHLMLRGRLLLRLQQLSGTGEAPSDDAALRHGLEQLRDHEAAARAETTRAIEQIDAVLTVPQQARFRLFEEQLERRKLELLSRARERARRPGR
jgi:hypothetical protein